MQTTTSSDGDEKSKRFMLACIISHYLINEFSDRTDANVDPAWLNKYKRDI